ncbi:MAG: MBL fold metallo-hydrolase [Chlamydiota bacterium]
MKASFLFLGSGASMGTPVIGCSCLVCQDKRQWRLRSSGLLRIGDRRILFDAGPDFRQQALNYGVFGIEALLLTHSHYDHIGGLEDLRIFSYQKKGEIPCFLSKETGEMLEKKSYLQQFFAPTFLPSDQGEFFFGGLPFSYFQYWQDTTRVTGFRFGSFAYVTDISRYEPSIFSALSGVKTLVLSACGLDHSHVHLGLRKAISFAQEVGASQVFFTHVCHRIDAFKERSKLPSSMQFAYDGLEIPLECEHGI